MVNIIKNYLEDLISNFQKPGGNVERKTFVISL